MLRHFYQVIPNVGLKNRMNIFRNIVDAIAGWKVSSSMAKLEKMHKNFDYLTLSVFAPEAVSLSETENKLNEARKDLWLHFSNEHYAWWNKYKYGGWWNKHKSNFICYNPDSHFIIEETLSFWMQNIKRLQCELIPLTNPLWLQNQSGDIIRLHATISLHESSTAHQLNTSVSVANPSHLNDLDNLLTFPSENSRSFFVYFKKENDWDVIEPSGEHLQDWERWHRKNVEWTGY